MRCCYVFQSFWFRRDHPGISVTPALFRILTRLLQNVLLVDTYGLPNFDQVFIQ